MRYQILRFRKLILFTVIALTQVAISAQPLQGQPNTSEERLTRLEARMAALEEANAENHRFLQIITFIGAIIGFLMGLDRFREGSRIESLRKEYAEKFAKYQEETRSGRERQEAKQNELIDTARNNIEAASGLFGALESMLQLQKTASSVGETIQKLEKKSEEQAQIRSTVINEQNREAMDIWKTVDRSNYASIDRQERFHEFSIRLESRKQEFTLADSELNAACYLLPGLDLRVRDDRKRIELLSKAVDIAKRDLDAETTEFVRPGMSVEAFKQWNRACLNEGLFYLAIVLYNLGEYRLAVPKFEEAIKYDPGDLGAKMYIPEAKFLGPLVDDFEQIVAEFQALAELIQRKEVTLMWDQDKKNALLSLLWVRFGNCYYARSSHEPFTLHRSLTRALDCYKTAYTLGPGSYLAQLSYAQALSAFSKQNLPDSKREELSALAKSLFAEVFPKVRDKLATTVEPKIRMMLYYMLAICVKEAQIEGELPQAYLTQIHTEKGNLGTSRVHIFSPRTKNDLNVADFITEVQEYQRSLPSLST